MVFCFVSERIIIKLGCTFSKSHTDCPVLHIPLCPLICVASDSALLYIMVLALFSIHSNVSDVGKVSDFISCSYVLQERKVYKLYKGKCCVHHRVVTSNR